MRITLSVVQELFFFNCEWLKLFFDWSFAGEELIEVYNTFSSIRPNYFDDSN